MCPPDCQGSLLRSSANTTHQAYHPNIDRSIINAAVRALHTMLISSSSRPVCHHCALRQQLRHASLLRRPKRPYTFTQLITLSDGSTFTHRTTSPAPIYRSTKDTKNSPLWNPSSQKLLNIEEDEAGRLKRFRGRFGRGWDAEVVQGNEEVRLLKVDDLTLVYADMVSRCETAKKRSINRSKKRAYLI